MVTTERMNIFPISIEKLKEIVKKEENEILKIAYQEMLDGCLDYPENYIWYTLWFMELKDSKNEIVGTLSFKGINEIWNCIFMFFYRFFNRRSRWMARRMLGND